MNGLDILFVLLVAGLLSSLFDGWTTVRNLKKDPKAYEAGPIHYVIGRRPSAFWVYTASVAVWALVSWLCIYAFSFSGLWFFPMLGVIAAHLYGGIHNLRQ